MERAFGYPDWLYRAIGHPVTWLGWLIGAADRALNRESWPFALRRLAGIVVLAFVLLIGGGVAFLLQAMFGAGVDLVVAAILGSALLAQNSLADHVEAVADALEHGGVEAGRVAVSRIVGRDPAMLDEAGVARAAIESLAENFSDGVAAPAFWMAVAGLPGAAIYKATNTADSMIGYRTPRHQAFGWAAARFDDLINLPASRLTGLLIVCAAFTLKDADPRQAWRAMWRDARKHWSPNAGWPEAAMAGALGLALAGPRIYNGVAAAGAVMGEGGRRTATAEDIRRALRLYWRADALLIAFIAVLAVAVMLHG